MLLSGVASHAPVGRRVVDEELAVEVVDGRDCAVVTVAGPLALRTIPQLNGTLGQALVHRGCVLVDAAGLRLEWEPGVDGSPRVGIRGGWRVPDGLFGETASWPPRCTVLQIRKPCRWPRTGSAYGE